MFNNKIILTFWFGVLFLGSEFTFGQGSDTLNNSAAATIKDNQKTQEIGIDDKTLSNLLPDNSLLIPVSSIKNLFLGKDESSLMFSDQELDDIERAINAYSQGTSFNASTSSQISSNQSSAEQQETKAYAHLNSILYLSPQNWSVWINNTKISSENNKAGNEFYIKSLDQASADIIWTISLSKWKVLYGTHSEQAAPPLNKDNQIELSFSLQQNQSYLLSSSKIVEGKTN